MDEKAKEIGNQAAYPVASDGKTHPTVPGMTLREHLIGCALTGMRSSPLFAGEDSGAVAAQAIADADATLAALAREGE